MDRVNRQVRCFYYLVELLQEHDYFHKFDDFQGVEGIRYHFGNIDTLSLWTIIALRPSNNIMGTFMMDIKNKIYFKCDNIKLSKKFEFYQLNVIIKLK